MASNAIRVALTGFDGLESPGPGMSVARALREGWPGELNLTAFGHRVAMTGAWQPGLVDRLALLPETDAGPNAAFQALTRTQNDRPFDAVIPGGDRDARLFAALSPRLDERGTRTLLPSADRLAALRSDALPRFLHDNGIETPMTAIVAEPADISRQADQIGYPLYVKGSTATPKLVFDSGQAAAAARSVSSMPDAAVVLQRQAPGDRFCVAMVADGQGVCAGMVVMRDLATNTDGRPVCGAVVDDPEIREFALEILEAADWRGPMEIEVVRPGKSGRLWLTDLRCQLPSWSMLCHWSGANLAAVLLEQILAPGEHRTEPRARVSTMFVRGVAETAVPLEDLVRLGRQGCIEAPAPRNGADHRDDASAGRGLRIAVTGASTFDVVNPGLGVARALRSAPDVAAIYGLVYGTFDSGIYQSELFDAAFRIPPADSHKALLRRLREVYESHPFDVLIPCLDGELTRFIAISDDLRKMGVQMLLPTRASLKRRSKLALFGDDMPADWGGFIVPESRIAKSEAETVAAVEAIGNPAVVKGPESQCVTVADGKDARSAWQKLTAADADAVIVQPCIPGEIYAVSVVCDSSHRVLSSLTVKKLAICERGSTWSALSVAQPELEAAFVEFLSWIKWVGPAEGEFIRDALTDRFYLIEVNPRFTAWIYFSAALGLNQPHFAARAATDEPMVPSGNDSALVFMRSCDEVRMHPGQLAALSAIGSLSHD